MITMWINRPLCKLIGLKRACLHVLPDGAIRTEGATYFGWGPWQLVTWQRNFFFAIYHTP
jgi:hypothetical protein